MSIDYEALANLPLPEEDLAAARQPIGGYAAEPPPPQTNMQGPPVMGDDGSFQYPQAPQTNQQGPPQMRGGAWQYPGQFQDQGSSWQPYFDGDEFAILRGMTTEDRARLQDQMQALGLTRGTPLYGEIDDATLDGMRNILSMSNRQAEPWESTLSRIATNFDPTRDAEERDPFRFVESEYLPPDPAEVRNSIRDLAQQIVPDVDVSDEEVEYLREQFEGMGAQQFRAHQEQLMNDARAEYDANAPVAPGTDEVITQSEGVQQVNAAEQFREFFENRYSANIQRGEDVEQESNRRDMTQGNLGRLLQIATGA